MKLLLSAFVFVLSFLCLSDASWAQPRSICETDLFKFTWMADPQLTSDATEAAYVLVNVDAKRERYQRRIWSVATASGQARPLTTGPRDSAPRWSPDGKHLAFLRQLEKDGKSEPAQIWVAPRSGGQAVQLTRLPKGAATLHWSPDGKTIAFLSNTKRPGPGACRLHGRAGRGQASLHTRAQHRRARHYPHGLPRQWIGLGRFCPSCPDLGSWL